MKIAQSLMVGESISYARNEILAAIEQDQLPSKRNWYAITTTFEQKTLFYILSGIEYRHPLYHRRDPQEFGTDQAKELTLLGIAGSREEALSIIQDMILHIIQFGSVRESKRILEEW